MSNPGHSVGHFEIPADRTDELKGFYSSLFGWQFEKRETQDYWMIKNAGISGGLASKENAEQMPTMSVSVESIEDYISKAKQLGVRIVRDKQELMRDITRDWRILNKTHLGYGKTNNPRYIPCYFLTGE